MPNFTAGNFIHLKKARPNPYWQQQIKKSDNSLMARDLRQFARQTNLRLIVGGLLLVFAVGDGLIYLFLGEQAANLGFICLVIGVAPLLLVWLVLWGIEWIVKRSK
jgi:hypothetical protein